ncbi:MAG: hypothetical protein A3H42_03625 [Deltaproteobacteria bacterium RIFCSPLOWO2_02_FULL_46_8]|nr:MAG: hypothetical protein A3H42_03625 [Deltaproteobacteria bacterium RIFCSPLOWO2_02_FULL_46_8]
MKGVRGEGATKWRVVPPDIMELWKEFEANQLTHSAAHYLVAVHDLIGEQGYARSSGVAKKLGIARSSASMGLHALIEKGFLKEDANKFLQITAKGQKLAKEIIGKKIVLKRFFQDILKVDPYQAEVDTCKIEHLVSSETGANLLAFIRFISSNKPEVKKVLEMFWKNCTTCDTTSLKELTPAKLHSIK